MSLRAGAVLHRQALPLHHLPPRLPRQHRNHEDNIPQHSLSGWNSKIVPSSHFLQVRPVLIPVELVPRQKATAQPEQEAKGDKGEKEQPLPDDLVDQTHERGFVDQTFRKFGQWEEKTSLQAATDVPPTTTIPPPVTPYTIVSSSMTVTKLVWENGRWDPQKVDEISSKIDPYEPINIEQRQSPSYPYLGEGRAREEGFLESIGGAVFGLFGG